MSLQWTLAAGFLYLEIALVLLMVLPIVSAKNWKKLFQSKFLKSLKQQGGIYFIMLLSTLVLLCLDAIKDMSKYSTKEKDVHKNLDAEMQWTMRLFRAQRNFYISGFALFLALVIRRLVKLISTQGQILSENKLMKADIQTNVAKTIKIEKDVLTVTKNVNVNEEKLNNKIKDLEKSLVETLTDYKTLQERIAVVHDDYDKLAEEHSKLLKNITSTSNKDL